MYTLEKFSHASEQKWKAKLYSSMSRRKLSLQIYFQTLIQQHCVKDQIAANENNAKIGKNDDLLCTCTFPMPHHIH